MEEVIIKRSEYLIAAVLFLIVIFCFGCKKNTTEPQTEPQLITFDEHPVDLKFDGIHCIRVSDLDGDGDLDIIGGSEITPYSQSLGIAWWRNEGGDPPDWTRFTVDSHFDHVMSVTVGDIDGGKSIVICDMDRDGDPDLLGTASDADRITWWENRGGHPVDWTSHPVASYFIGSTGLDVIDMDEDGLFDVIGASWKSDEVSYWICQDLMNDQWQKTVVTDQLGTAVNVCGYDFDMDGDVDIVAVGKNPGEVAIYINDHFSWTKQILKSNFTGGSALSVMDLDGDGDVDIISGASALGRLYWWENRSIQ